MRRVFLLLVAVGCVSAAAVASLATTQKKAEPAASSEAKFIATTEAKNPWTNLTPNTSPEQFQFAIVSDRTGGHRAGIFSKAVQQINLLQPEFVMSVGDLIEGSTKAETNNKEWDEFDGYVRKFKMPFFYCPGNHDSLSKLKDGIYRERYGRPHYHFLYKNCLFVVLNSNDPNGVNDKGELKFDGNKIGAEQIQWLGGVLKENAAVRWTFVFLHHPIWTVKDQTKTGWPEVEKLLGGRKYNVYCGHEHVYRMFPRNGTNYYQLATTGGGSAVRGVEYGEFDQCAWITMKDTPVMANIVLNGVLPHDLAPIASTEGGKKDPEPGTLAEVFGRVTFNGQAPPPGLQIVFSEIVPDKDKPGQVKPGYVGNSRLAADGSYAVYATRGAMGVKPGRYAVTFTLSATTIVDPKKKPENPIPEAFRSFTKTPYKIDIVPSIRNQHNFALSGG